MHLPHNPLSSRRKQRRAGNTGNETIVPVAMKATLLL
ncbi:hypothetical protein RABR111495_22225 [Rahnella bruchi]